MIMMQGYIIRIDRKEVIHGVETNL